MSLVRHADGVLLVTIDKFSLSYQFLNTVKNSHDPSKSLSAATISHGYKNANN